MMHHHIAIVAAGAAAHFLTGWVLNCDLLLGKIWKQEKDKKACGLSKDMRVNLAAQILASTALSIGVCVAITIFEKSQLPTIGNSALEKLVSLFFSQDHNVKSMMNSMHTVLFVWAGFILPNAASEVIWCGHNWKHWLLEMGADLLGLMAIAAVVTFLA